MQPNTLTTEKTTCYHCGESCSSDGIRLSDKLFCCEGCRMVYRILNDNELNTYYCLDETPGISLNGRPGKKAFDYLDDDSVVDELVDFHNGQTTSISLHIPGIHCTSCVWLLEKLYRLDDGITGSNVHFLRRELYLTYDHHKTTLRKIVELLHTIGYEPDLRMDRIDDGKRKTTGPNRRLWLKLGVAGFAFGNIMLFSFPDYLAGPTYDLEGSFRHVFGFLNIALGLPVLLYSSSDYLKSAWAAVKQKGINLDVPISIGILALFGRSFYEILTGIGAGYMDSFTGLVFFLLIGRLIQKKTFDRLAFDRDYKSYLPLSVTVIDEDDEEKSISVGKLIEDDRMLIRNHELVPADADLLSEQCFVDYSFITGESEPVKISQGETIYAGGRIVGRSARMSAIREVSSSYLTKLWNNAAFDARTGKRTVSSLADRVSPHFTLGVLAVAVLAGLWWMPAGMEQAINVFTAVLIIACPCALALSTPFTLGSALNILSRNGLYIKGIEVIESLSKVTHVVFDKTGTLTRSDCAEVSFVGGTLDEAEQGLVHAVCRQSVHPLSRKIVTHLDRLPVGPVEEFEEHINKGLKACVCGRDVLLGSLSYLEGETGKRLPDANPGPQATTGSTVHVAIDGRWKGRFIVKNRYRHGIYELLQDLKQRFSTYLISGDNELQKEELVPYFQPEALLFNRTPQEKLDFVHELQRRGSRVLMIGDGLNDAGALRQSDFGIALTDNISSFTPASDAILDGEAAASLDRFIRFARKSIRIILLSFGISLLYNVVGLGFAVTGQLSPLVAAVLMPLSSISIMLFTTITTHLVAKKMGLATWK